VERFQFKRIRRHISDWFKGRGFGYDLRAHYPQSANTECSTSGSVVMAGELPLTSRSKPTDLYLFLLLRLLPSPVVSRSPVFCRCFLCC